MTAPNTANWPANLPPPNAAASFSPAPDRLLAGLFPGPLPDAPESHQKAWPEFRSLPMAHRAALQAIAADPMLSAEGQRLAVERANAARDATLAKGRALAEKQAQHLADARARAAAQSAPLPDTAATVATHAETTRHLLSRTADELSVIASRAASLNDVGTLVALAHLPAALSPDDVANPWRETAKAALLETSKPGLAEEFDRAAQHLSYFEAMLNTVQLYCR
jgi:hypothetical protein